MSIKNALSIDLEDWNHPEFVRKYIPFNPKPQIIDSTKEIIKLLDKYDIKATFFILGDVAKKHPNLIRMLYNKGHEIASHGMSHIPLKNMNYDDFNKELNLFKKTINKIIGNDVKIYGYRAPTFSLNYETNYAFKGLINNNYIYDSSIVPTNLFYYGLKKAPREIYKPNLNNPILRDSKSKIIEFPMTVFDILKLSIPISGGFFLRIFPYFIYKTLLTKINNKNRPFIIYFHPWETFYRTYRVKNIGIVKYFITYFGINNALDKIESLLRDFKFGSVYDVISENFK